ncbi:MAG: DnaJ domain-containing protein, partial [Spirochaetales bacterium]|nr:DnaJ domain-containing protein [Spirochaetales bacterium]
MEDCYQILGIPSSASASEIKRAFRRKAKELHPDIPVGGQAVIDRQERMRDLIR